MTSTSPSGAEQPNDPVPGDAAFLGHIEDLMTPAVMGSSVLPVDEVADEENNVNSWPKTTNGSDAVQDIEATPIKAGALSMEPNQSRKIHYWLGGALLVVMIILAVVLPVTLTQRQESGSDTSVSLTRGQSYESNGNNNYVYYKLSVEPDDEEVTCDLTTTSGSSGPSTYLLKLDSKPQESEDDINQGFGVGSGPTHWFEKLYIGNSSDGHAEAKLLYLAIQISSSYQITCIFSKQLSLDVPVKVDIFPFRYTSYVLDWAPNYDEAGVGRRLRCTTADAEDINQPPIDMFQYWTYPSTLLKELPGENCNDLNSDNAEVICNSAFRAGTSGLFVADHAHITFWTNATEAVSVYLTCQDLPALEHLAPLFPGSPSRLLSLLKGDVVNTTMIVDRNASMSSLVRCASTHASNGTASLILQFDTAEDPETACESAVNGASSQVCWVTPPLNEAGERTSLFVQMQALEEQVRDLSVECDYLEMPNPIQLYDGIASSPLSMVRGSMQTFTFDAQDPIDDIKCTATSAEGGEELYLHWNNMTEDSGDFGCFSIGSNCTVAPPGGLLSQLYVNVYAAEGPLSNLTVTCLSVAPVPINDGVATDPLDLHFGERQLYAYGNATFGHAVHCQANTSNNASLDMYLLWGGNSFGDDDTLANGPCQVDSICTAISPSSQPPNTLFVSVMPSDLLAKDVEVTCSSSPIINLLDDSPSDTFVLPKGGAKTFMIEAGNNSLVECFTMGTGGLGSLSLHDGTIFQANTGEVCEDDESWSDDSGIYGTWSQDKCSIVVRRTGLVYATLFATEAFENATISCQTKLPLALTANLETDIIYPAHKNDTIFFALALNGTKKVNCETPFLAVIVGYPTQMTLRWDELPDLKNESVNDCISADLSCSVVTPKNGSSGVLYGAVSFVDEFALMCETTTALPLSDGIPSEALTLASGRVQHYVFTIPDGADEVVCTTAGLNGTANFYVRFDSFVDIKQSEYDYSQRGDGKYSTVPSDIRRIFAAVEATKRLNNAVITCKTVGATQIYIGQPSNLITLAGSASALFALNTSNALNTVQCIVTFKSGQADVYFLAGDIPSPVDYACAMNSNNGACGLMVDSSPAVMYALVQADGGVKGLVLSCTDVSAAPLTINDPSSPVSFTNGTEIYYYSLDVVADEGYDISCSASQASGAGADVVLSAKWSSLPRFVNDTCTAKGANKTCVVSYRVGHLGVGHLYLGLQSSTAPQNVTIACSRVEPDVLALDSSYSANELARGQRKLFQVAVNTTKYEEVTCTGVYDQMGYLDDSVVISLYWFSAPYLAGWSDGYIDDYANDLFPDYCLYDYGLACSIAAPIPSSPSDAVTNLYVRLIAQKTVTGLVLNCTGSVLYY